MQNPPFRFSFIFINLLFKLLNFVGLWFGFDLIGSILGYLVLKFENPVVFLELFTWFL